IERRHGLPHPTKRELDPVIIDRFLAAYLPEAREGEPAPQALEFAFAPTLTESLDLLRDVVCESRDGRGSALYVHDLDIGVGADARALPCRFPDRPRPGQGGRAGSRRSPFCCRKPGAPCARLVEIRPRTGVVACARIHSCRWPLSPLLFRSPIVPVRRHRNG